MSAAQASPPPGFPRRALSTVELYSRGLPLERSYDLPDPPERAIFLALQAYLSREETLVVEAGLRPGTPFYHPWRSPAVFEDDARTLAAWKRGRSDLPARERWRLAVSVLRAMFSPAEAKPDADFVVRPDFFDVGKGYAPPHPHPADVLRLYAQGDAAGLRAGGLAGLTTSELRVLAARAEREIGRRERL